MNRLYFGDNLEWLRNPKAFLDASVDLFISTRRLIQTPVTIVRSAKTVPSQK